MTAQRIVNFLGHSDASTTMGSTHVPNKGGRGVKSPLGRLEQPRAEYLARPDAPGGAAVSRSRRFCYFRAMDWNVAAFFLALALLAWLWYDSMRARERAVAAGQAACAREGLQFLDETVECVSVRPARNDSGRLVLRRVYRFEFSDDGTRRRAGQIVMFSGEVESLTMEPFLLR